MRYYVVDAFTDRLFGGNPAGVCLMDEWIDGPSMQKIAFENNLSETAFLVKRDGLYELRWFTPKAEVDLCGHATLGSALVLMNFVDRAAGRIDFSTKSGRLTVRRQGDFYLMDFPSRMPAPCALPAGLEEALGVKAVETHLARDMLILVEKESDVANLRPDCRLLSKIDLAFAFIVTARGSDCDFVSRFFAPGVGVDEDPVTGSSHCTLIPFWSERLHKTEMTARQLSQRGGFLVCKNGDGRVEIGGKAVCYLKGEIAC